MSIKQTLGVLSLMCVFVSGALIVRAEDAKAVPSELQLRVQVQQLTEQLHASEVQFAQCRAQAADTQARLDSLQLTSQAADVKARHEALDIELRKALGAQDGDTVDYSTSPPSLKKKDVK